MFLNIDKVMAILNFDDIINDDVNTNIYQLGHMFLVHTCADFDNDIFITYEVMMKNALNMFTRGYRRLNLSSRCDVINGVMNMTYFLLYNLHMILPYLMPKGGYIENCKTFKTDEILKP